MNRTRPTPSPGGQVSVKTGEGGKEDGEKEGTSRKGGGREVRDTSADGGKT